MPHYQAYVLDDAGSAPGPAYHLVCDTDDEAIKRARRLVGCGLLRCGTLIGWCSDLKVAGRGQPMRTVRRDRREFTLYSPICETMSDAPQNC